MEDLSAYDTSKPDFVHPVVDYKDSYDIVDDDDNIVYRFNVESEDDVDAAYARAESALDRLNKTKDKSGIESKMKSHKEEKEKIPKT